MKPISQSPHDPLDELLAAALHGELTPDQRAELDALLQHDPAARAAYQETQTMHDLLERNHRDLKPDPNFEERIISGVRRKARDEKVRHETMGESIRVLWRAVKWPFVARPAWILATIAMACLIVYVALFSMGQRVRGTFSTVSGVSQFGPYRQASTDDTLAQAHTKNPAARLRAEMQMAKNGWDEQAIFREVSKAERVRIGARCTQRF